MGLEEQEIEHCGSAVEILDGEVSNYDVVPFTMKHKCYHEAAQVSRLQNDHVTLESLGVNV